VVSSLFQVELCAGLGFIVCLGFLVLGFIVFLGFIVTGFIVIGLLLVGFITLTSGANARIWELGSVNT